MGFQFFRRVVKSGGDSDITVTESTAANIAFHGTSIVFSSAPAKKHTLSAPPAIGTYKTIICKKATTTNTATVYLPTGWSYQKSSNSTGVKTRKLSFNSGAQSVILQSISTSKVAIVGNTNSVTASSS